MLQGWNPGEAPVLWSEWVADGIVMRQEVFAHVPGGRPVQTGTEPLFAWVRLSVHDMVEGLPVPDSYGFVIKINAARVGNHDMSMRNNFRLLSPVAAYPRALTPEPAAYDDKQGWRLVEPDGKVRLGLPAGQKRTATFHPDTPSETDELFFIPLPSRKGESVDLLVPMLPTERAVFDAELALGYDGDDLRADSGLLRPAGGDR